MKRIYPQEDKRWPGIKNCLAYLWNGDRKEEDDIDARVNKHVKEVLQILEQSTQQQKQQKEDAQLRIEMSSKHLGEADKRVEAARHEHEKACQRLSSLQPSRWQRKTCICWQRRTSTCKKSTGFYERRQLSCKN